jgi:hypothetical protein
MREIKWHLSFWVWLILLYMMISSSIHFPANDTICSFYGWAIVHCVHTFPLSIHLLMDTYADSTTWLLWSVAINFMCRYAFLYTDFISFIIYSGVVEQDHMFVLVLVFENLHTNFQSGTHFLKSICFCVCFSVSLFLLAMWGHQNKTTFKLFQKRTHVHKLLLEKFYLKKTTDHRISLQDINFFA